MSLKAHLRSRLLADTAVAALVAERIYSGRVPQEAQTPYLLLFVTNTDFTHHMRGRDETNTALLQVNCISVSSTEAESLANRVKDCLDCHTGTLEGTRIDSCLITNLHEDHWSDDVGLFRHIADFKISYLDS